MKRIILIFFLIPLALNFNCSQNRISESLKYFFLSGQTPPGKTAQLFAPEIIRHLAHSSPTFTPDGKEIFWSTVSENNKPRTIYHIKYENNNWSAPKVAPFSGNYHDDHPFISYDGQKLYFASKRPKILNGPQENDIWISDRTDQGWGEPKPIDKLIGFWTPSVTRTGTIYFLDIIEEFEAKGFINRAGIFRSELINGEYSAPEFLSEKINKKDSQNWCPFIAPDESYLIFSSDREGGFGSGDLYICFRDENNEWKKPINMGESINTAKQERFPGVSPDGKYLFFTRWFAPPNHHDLYWIDADIINELKEQAQ